ncbi:unnamed protein product [Urochloa humidicola]
MFKFCPQCGARVYFNRQHGVSAVPSWKICLLPRRHLHTAFQPRGRRLLFPSSTLPCGTPRLAGPAAAAFPAPPGYPTPVSPTPYALRANVSEAELG